MVFKTSLGIQGGDGRDIQCSVKRHHSNVELSIIDPCDINAVLMVCVDKDDYKRGLGSLREMYENRINSRPEEINAALGLCEVEDE